MCALTVAGVFSAPVWIVPLGATILLALSLWEHGELRVRASNPLASAAVRRATLAFAAISIGFSLLCYVGGQLLGTIVLSSPA